MPSSPWIPKALGAGAAGFGTSPQNPYVYGGLHHANIPLSQTGLNPSNEVAGTASIVADAVGSAAAAWIPPLVTYVFQAIGGFLTGMVKGVASSAMGSTHILGLAVAVAVVVVLFH